MINQNEVVSSEKITNPIYKKCHQSNIIIFRIKKNSIKFLLLNTITMSMLLPLTNLLSQSKKHQDLTQISPINLSYSSKSHTKISIKNRSHPINPNMDYNLRNNKIRK